VLSKKTYFSFALIWTLIVTILSLIPMGDVGSTIKIAYKDKYVHFTFYFVFVVLWFSFAKKRNIKNINLIILFSAIGYGILMEICQGVFTTTRTADVYDAIANSFGAFFGLLFINYLFKKKES
jgi:VanZ family protein